MANDFPSRRAPDDLKSVEFARADGSIRKITPRDGVLKATDAADDAVLASYGYPVADDAPKAKSSRTAKATAARKAKAAAKAAEREQREADEAAAANREVGSAPDTEGND